MSFPRYSEYKESGVEWLGSVPAQWDIFALKRTVDSCRNGIWGNEPDGENDVAVIRVADFNRSSLRVGLDKLTYRSVSASEYDPRALLQGDLLIEKSGGGEKTLVGCVVLFDYDFKAVTSNFVARMRALESFDSKFLCYCFDTLYQGRVNYPAIKQTTGIQNLASEAYLQELFCFPPHLDQTQIACFLDHETARIDALIELQQRLIELLKEARQAVISHAVTKGLDPTVPMKDSGVEWLGAVPAHWDVTQLKHCVDPNSSITYGIVQAGPHYDQGVPYIRTSDMSTDQLPSDGYPLTSPEIDAAYARSRVRPGDIVISIRASVGKCLPVPDDLLVANLTQGTAKISPGASINKNFLMSFLGSDSSQAYFDSMSKGATFKEITLDALRRTPVLIPPIAEQDAIDRRVGARVVSLDKTKTIAIESIRLLKARRSALISAAVTGKIDVRNWQPPASESEQELQQEPAHG